MIDLDSRSDLLSFQKDSWYICDYLPLHRSSLDRGLGEGVEFCAEVYALRSSLHFAFRCVLYKIPMMCAHLVLSLQVCVSFVLSFGLYPQVCALHWPVSAVQVIF